MEKPWNSYGAQRCGQELVTLSLENASYSHHETKYPFVKINSKSLFYAGTKHFPERKTLLSAPWPKYLKFPHIPERAENIIGELNFRRKATEACTSWDVIPTRGKRFLFLTPFYFTAGDVAGSIGWVVSRWKGRVHAILPGSSCSWNCHSNWSLHLEHGFGTFPSWFRNLRDRVPSLYMSIEGIAEAEQFPLFHDETM